MRADPGRDVARRIRAGRAHIDGSSFEAVAALGGCRKSRKGGEWGGIGFEDFLETRSMFGYAPA